MLTGDMTEVLPIEEGQGIPPVVVNGRINKEIVANRTRQEYTEYADCVISEALVRRDERRKANTLPSDWIRDSARIGLL